MEVTRTGGLIGVDDRVTAGVDGSVTVARDGVPGTPTVMDADDFAELKRLLIEAAATVPPAEDTPRRTSFPVLPTPSSAR
jgi:hypothetical protein